MSDLEAIQSEFDRLAAFEGPGALDRLPAMREARRQAYAWLPGARVRHHLLWRYSIRWQADPGRSPALS